MQRLKKAIGSYLAVMIAVVLCFAPYVKAYGEEVYEAWQNFVYEGEMIKAGIRASQDIIPSDCVFTVETVEGYIEMSVNDRDDDSNRLEKLEEGKYATIYVQIPEGMTAEELQTKIIIPAGTAQYDPATEEIDDILYLVFRTDSFEKIEPLPAGDAIKSLAKKELAGYKDPADYREAQQEELAAVLQEVNAAIEEAETMEEVETIVAEAKEALDAIKTDAQLPPETPLPPENPIPPTGDGGEGEAEPEPSPDTADLAGVYAVLAVGSVAAAGMLRKGRNRKIHK